MKLTTLSITLMLGMALSSGAQQFYPLGIGAAIVEKVGVNAGDIPNGQKTELSINPVPDFLVSVWYIVAPREDFGFSLDFGYSTNSYIMKPFRNATNDTKWRNSLHYFIFYPSLRFKMFNLGLGIGIPLSGERRNLSGTFSDDIDVGAQATLMELRLAMVIPLYRDATGRLNFVLTGSYQLNGIYADDIPNNPRVASAGVGLSYHFHVKLWEY